MLYHRQIEGKWYSYSTFEYCTSDTMQQISKMLYGSTLTLVCQKICELFNVRLIFKQIHKILTFLFSLTFSHLNSTKLSCVIIGIYCSWLCTKWYQINLVWRGRGPKKPLVTFYLIFFTFAHLKFKISYTKIVKYIQLSWKFTKKYWLGLPVNQFFINECSFLSCDLNCVHLFAVKKRTL